MKKVKFNGKLSLNKETIANLNNDNLENIKGGAGPTGSCSCDCTKTCPCTNMESACKTTSVNDCAWC
jgi:hypothetical protein